MGSGGIILEFGRAALGGGMKDFERLGGEQGLRSLIEDFVDRCYRDMMIGYLFKRAEPARVKRFEYEHAASFLGAGTYGGRPLREAHASHAIVGAQFDRRLRILEETMRAHGAPADVIGRMVAHQLSLRALVQGGDEARCVAKGTEET
jgi:hemoglobin